MVFGTTRKLSLLDDDLTEPARLSLLDDDDLTEAAPMTTRTRPRLEMEPIGPLHLNIPQPQPSSTPPIDTHLTHYICCLQHSSQLQQPLPQLPSPQSQQQQQQQQLSLPQHALAPPLPPPPPPPPRRNRRNPTHAPQQGKPLTIQPPFPWATDRRAHVYSLTYLTEIGITTVSGDVKCKRCERCYQIEYALTEKFTEIGQYIAENKIYLHDRAPSHWMEPILPKCNYCHQEKSLKPKMAEKKRCINWLFLLLGQMLGCCSLNQLKYFCKHTGNHRTGAKDRILYLTYLGLCKQVYPNGPFNLT